MSIVPEVGVSRQPSRCMRVDLPLPLGPMIAAYSPWSMVRLIPSSARIITRPSAPRRRGAERGMLGGRARPFQPEDRLPHLAPVAAVAGRAHLAQGELERHRAAPQRQATVQVVRRLREQQLGQRPSAGFERAELGVRHAVAWLTLNRQRHPRVDRLDQRAGSRVVTFAQTRPRLARARARSFSLTRFIRRQLTKADPHQCPRRRGFFGPYSTTSILIRATPARSMPRRSAAARDRSRIRPRGPYGPRSVTRT